MSREIQDVHCTFSGTVNIGSANPLNFTNAQTIIREYVDGTRLGTEIVVGIPTNVVFRMSADSTSPSESREVEINGRLFWNGEEVYVDGNGFLRTTAP